MTKKIQPDPRSPVLRVDGELRYGRGLANFRARFEEACQRQNDIVVDLEAVEGVDSAGLGELVRALRRVTAEGGHLTLLKPPAKVRRFLAATGLSSLFGVAEPPDFLLDARMQVS